MHHASANRPVIVKHWPTSNTFRTVAGYQRTRPCAVGTESAVNPSAMAASVRPDERQPQGEPLPRRTAAEVVPSACQPPSWPKAPLSSAGRTCTTRPIFDDIRRATRLLWGCTDTVPGGVQPARPARGQHLRPGGAGGEEPPRRVARRLVAGVTGSVLLVDLWERGGAGRRPQSN